VNWGNKCRALASLGVLSFLLMLIAPTGASAAPAPKGTLESLVDAIGDVLGSVLDAPLDDARGDITAANVEYGEGWVRLDVQARRATSPLRDPNWESGSTYVLWSLDTTGDGKADYSLEYGISQGQLYGAVFPPGAPADSPASCDADSVTFSTSGLYSMVVSPDCLGRPRSIAWNVELSYDTNAKDPGAPATSDRLPDQGFSAAVLAPSAPAPVAAPLGASNPTAPATPDLKATTQPTAAKPVVAPPRAQRPDSSGMAGRPTPAPAGQAASPRPVPVAVPSLPRTGSDHRNLVCAGAILTVGGLLLISGARRGSPSPVGKG
jgi:hypothetical protein